MYLSDHSLRQMDDAYVRSLDWEALCGLSLRLLADLKEARDRLNQGPENSSRQPRRWALWERKGDGQEPEEDPEDGDREPEAAVPPAESPAEDSPLGEAKPAEVKAVEEVPPAAVKSARKAGKPPGAPGIGRTQVLRRPMTNNPITRTCVRAVAGC